MNKIEFKLSSLRDILLDTGRRSQLLYFKSQSKTLIEIKSPNHEGILKSISSNNPFTFSPSLINADRDVNKSYLETDLDNQEMYQRLNNLYFKAKTLSEDSGVQGLFITIGKVTWPLREKGKVVEQVESPLLLVPVKLFKKNNQSFELLFINESPAINPILKVYFQKQFGITDLIEDFSNEEFNFKDYFKSLQNQLIKSNIILSFNVFLGVFSYSKMAIYHDVNNYLPAIAQQDLIKVFLNDAFTKQRFQASQATLINQGNHLPHNQEALHVVDADSSQSRAVQMASLGLSFVIQGPPGTGKSQTITNMISSLIGQSKKVLFVSEKMAALDIVYTNMSKVLLDPFCLVLHSTKTKKDDVIKELYDTLNKQKSQIDNYDDQVFEYDQIQSLLSENSNRLHAINPQIKMSLFDLIEKFFSFDDNTQYYLMPNLFLVDKKTYEKHLGLISEFVNKVQRFNFDVTGYPLMGMLANLSVQDQGLSPKFYEDYLFHVQTIKKALSRLLGESVFHSLPFHQLLTLFNQQLKTRPKEFENMENFSPNKDWFDRKTFRLIETKTKILNKHILRIRQFQTTFLTYPIENILRVQTDDLRALKKLSLSWQVFKNPYFFFERIADLNLIHSNKKLLNREAKLFIDKMIEFKKAHDWVTDDSNYQFFASHFPLLYQGLETNLEKVFLRLNYFQFIQMSYQQIKNFIDNTQLIIKSLKDFSQANFSEIQQGFRELSWHLPKSLNLEAILEKMFKEKPTFFNMPILKLEETIGSIGKVIHQYFNWQEFRKFQLQLEKAAITPFLNRFNKVYPPNLLDIFKKSYYYTWIQSLLAQEVKSGDESNPQEDDLLNTFRHLDHTLVNKAKFKIRQILSALRRPLTVTESVQGNDVSILQEEFFKKRRKMPIRKLFETIPKLISDLKPVLMMSPTSVATYLPYGQYTFDTLIVDEASQIPQQDLLSAIARAKQVIIVGDSNQLPPTNFFIKDETRDFEDTDEETFESFGSVLDAAVGVNLPSVNLTWHYRSKHESLIAFSNSMIYQSRLFTFPSIHHQTDHEGIEYRYVSDSVYERGKKAINEREAAIIVELALKHAIQFPDRSLGIVTFNQAQQLLIESLLSDKLQVLPSHYGFFQANQTSEPFFVKNIENVQGDERDTIILGIGYGPDEQGKILMNFGPINKEGGEKRLNVAITRAKKNLKVVTSLQPHDFHLTAESPKGVHLLAKFIEFASLRGKTLEHSDSFYDLISDFHLAKNIQHALVNNGLHAQINYGFSTFKIDVVVKTPTAATYQMAILLDGKYYRTAETVKDREKIRVVYLQQQGWLVYRLNTLKWLNYKEKAIQEILEMIANPNQNRSSIEPTDNQVIEKVIDPEPLLFSNYQFYSSDDEQQPLQEWLKGLIQIEGPIYHEQVLRLAKKRFGEKKEEVLKIKQTLDEIIASDANGFIQKDIYHYYVYQGKYPGFRIYPQDQKRAVEFIHPKELDDAVLMIIRHYHEIAEMSIMALITKRLNYKAASSLVNEAVKNAVNRLLDATLIVKNEKGSLLLK